MDVQKHRATGKYTVSIRASRGRAGVARMAMLALLLLAFGVRVYRLDFQSLWSDEGISLHRAAMPLGEMLRSMPVEHAPGYFLLLHFWLGLAGAIDFALRFLSLWPSVLAIAVSYRVAADLGSRRAGLIASMLLATNAFQVWYAQEVRMYSWLLATGVGATWLLVRLLRVGAPRSERPSGGRGRDALIWAGYVALMTATIYLQYYGFLVPLAHALFALVWLWRTRDLRRFLVWVAAGVAVLMLYLPWVPRFLGLFAFPGWRQPLNPWQLPWRYLAAYTVGDAMPLPWHAWVPWLYLVLALAGIAAWWRRRFLAAFMLLLSTGVPLAGAFLLAFRQPDFHERYTIMISAPLILASAVGLVELGRLGSTLRWRASLARAAVTAASAALLCGLVAANALALGRLYDDATLHKPDFRAAALRIERSEQPGDVVLVDGPDPQKVFLHYYHGPAPVIDLRPLQGASASEVDAALGAATAAARRAWGLLYFHEPGPVQAWLARRGWPADETLHNGISVTLYGLPGGDPSVERREPVPFGPELALTGAGAGCASAKAEASPCRAGDLLRVTAAWDVSNPPPARRFSLRLQDAAGRLWAAEDYTPQDGFAPTNGWRPGVAFTDTRGLLLPADLPPSGYRVTLRLYDPSTGAAVDTPAGQDVLLGGIAVLPAATPPDPSGLPIGQRLNLKANEELSLIGLDSTPGPLRSDQPAEVVLWWRADWQPSQPYQVRLELKDGRGRVVAQGLYPLSIAPVQDWQPGEVVRERYPLTFAPATPGGSYRLVLTLSDAAGSAPNKPATIATLPVQARPRQYRLPRINHPLNVTLGDSIALRGYDLAEPRVPGEALDLTLYWQAKGDVPGNLKVFAHLVDGNGQIAAQSDSVPADGAAPTQGWLPGEVVRDRHTLKPPASGVYRLYVGMYDPAFGQRLPATDDAGRLIPDAAVPLEEVKAP